MNDYLAFISGVICAGIGGELFVRGAVGLAHWARISPGIIGATVTAFGTSSPELSVSINSALAGEPQIALGDALGSNVLNVALILAVALLISGIHTPRDSIKRDFPMAMLVPIITGVLCFDGVVSRIDGFVMLGAFMVWLVVTAIEARKQRSATDEVIGEHRVRLVFLSCMAGFAFLVVAGRLIVSGASGIATSLGIDEFIVGAVIVAVGTSVPELATTVIAKLRGHDEVSLGTILGSNIFNGLFIVAVAAIICPITVNLREVAITLIYGLVAVALTFPANHGLIERKRGVLLLVLFAIYLATILQY
jgi:cation:H+ antiporter